MKTEQRRYIVKNNKYDRTKLFDGTNKVLYQTNEDAVLIQFFKDTIKGENLTEFASHHMTTWEQILEGIL